MSKQRQVTSSLALLGFDFQNTTAALCSISHAGRSIVFSGLVAAVDTRKPEGTCVIVSCSSSSSPGNRVAADIVPTAGVIEEGSKQH